MTNEEAIEAIESIKFGHCDDIYYRKEYEEAVNMAIKALEQEPCDDSISRQAVLDCLTATKLKKFDFILQVRAEIKKLPPVSTEKTGRWIFDERIDKHYYCSECKAMGADYFDYCPYCGAKMGVEE